MNTKSITKKLSMILPKEIAQAISAICVAILCSISTFSHAETMRVGYFITSPHVIIEPETNKLTGACVEFFEKYIAPEMGITVEWAAGASSIPRLLNQLENHTLDVGLVFAKNAERETILNYPQNPFLTSHTTLAFLKNHPINKIEKPEDIFGLIIGYGNKAHISPFMRNKKIIFDIVSSPDWMDVNLLKLLSGRNDAIFQPESSSLLYYIKKHKLEDRVKLISLPETVGLYTTFSKKADKSLTERYDRAFEKINGTELYLQILSKYIDINSLR